MFIRKKKSANSDKRTVEIVRGERFAGKVRQIIVAYIGVIRRPEDEEQIMALAKVKLLELIKQENAGKTLTDEEALALSKRGRRKKIDLSQAQEEKTIEAVLIENLREEYRLVDGLHDVGGKALESFNIGRLFRTEKQNTLFHDLIVVRLGYAKSKRGLCEIMRTKMQLSYNEEQVYRLMDNIYPKIDQIKRKIFHHTQALMPSVNVLLFDVTTLYCESTTPDEVRHFGFSKDGKFNNTQVVLALATNERGLPISYEVFAGNCAETHTLLSAIQRWHTFLPIKNICFIGDRAMFSEDNLRLMESHGYQYIIAAKLRSQSADIQAKILNDTLYQPIVFGEETGRIAEFDVTPSQMVFRCSIGKKDFGYSATIENDEITNIVYASPQDERREADASAFVALKAGIQKLKRYSSASPCTVMSAEEYSLKQENTQNQIVILCQCVQILMMAPPEEFLRESVFIYKKETCWLTSFIASTGELCLDKPLLLPESLMCSLSEKWIKNDLDTILFEERQALLSVLNKDFQIAQDTLIYQKQSVIVDSLSTEVQTKLALKLARGKIPASLMKMIFPEYVGEKYIYLSETLLIKLFPQHTPTYRRLCVSYRQSRADNDAYKRQKILSRLATKEGAVNHVLKTPAKMYMTADGSAVLNRAKISAAERWDGLHGIITNIEHKKAQDLIAQYSQLWRIEESFRINKHQLSMRPMYHYKPERIHAHIAICYVTFAVLRLIEYQTALTQRALSIDRILAALCNTETSIYCDLSTQRRYKIPGCLSDDAKILYKSFGLTRQNIPTLYSLK